MNKTAIERIIEQWGAIPVPDKDKCPLSEYLSGKMLQALDISGRISNRRRMIAVHQAEADAKILNEKDAIALLQDACEHWNTVDEDPGDHDMPTQRTCQTCGKEWVT